MNPLGTAATLLAIFTVNSLANPNNAADLAKTKGCLNCHAIDHKIIGPAYQDVAAKYSGQKAAVDQLTQKVLNSGPIVWGGPMAMPAQKGALNPAEAKQLVQWVLNQPLPPKKK